jgi:hypothetical protein
VISRNGILLSKPGRSTCREHVGLAGMTIDAPQMDVEALMAKRAIVGTRKSRTLRHP